MKFRNFTLPSKNFHRLFSNDLNKKIVIVSVIGKTSLANKNAKLGILDELLDCNIEHESIEFRDEVECHINGLYDEEENVIYLNLKGSFDVNTLIKTFSIMSTKLKTDGFLSVWSCLKHQYARALMFLFSVSHVLIISHPSQFLDLSYIQLLKAISFIRPKYQAVVSNTLKSLDLLSEEWALHGRLCSPRLLFVFSQCPSSIQQEVGDEKIRRIKKLEHAIEDQIYLVLRKIRLVKNMCERACFSIAPNDEFVYVCCEEDISDINGGLISALVDDCKCYDSSEDKDNSDSDTDSEFDENDDGFGPNPFAILGFSDDDIQEGNGESLSGKDGEHNHSVHLELDEEETNSLGSNENSPMEIGLKGFELADEIEEIMWSDSDSHSDGGISDCSSTRRIRHSFKDFVMKHVNTAHKQGFRDNMGKYAITKPFFELPKLLDWFNAVNAILLESEIGLNSVNVGPSLQLEKLLNIELRFSNSRCGKVMPLAVVAYQENLPPHYTAKFHKEKVDHAISVFTRQGRGPEMRKYIEQLKEECDRYWKSGRQMCEILSLSCNPCTKPMHVPPNAQQSCQHGETEHWSGVRYVSSCNCGIRQGTRPDPFTIRAANLEFYQTIGKECGCNSLERINFPIFQPSINNFRAAELLNFYPLAGSGLQNSCNDLHVSTGSIQTLSIAKLWGPENSALVINTPHSNLTDNIHLVINSDQETHSERPLVRQASTTEYLPSMLHTESPMGLLPQFPSWSLVCRGPSSLYSHNTGLQDQPGFIPGSAYLLPWDVIIRQKERCWPTVSETPRRVQNVGRGTGYRKYRGPRDLFSVKIFVGVEYECLRGHRFMSSGPGKVLKASGSGLVKENATKVTKGHMPLYLPCPCGKTVAQLIRVHIVTPKAPVFVTINPKVRPAPSPCPVFVTGSQKPTPLSQSAYWVLRLPYVYADERETYKVPDDPTQLNYGELLGPMYGITEPK